MQSVFCFCFCLGMALSAALGASASADETGVMADLFGDGALKGVQRVGFGKAGSWTFQTYGSAALGDRTGNVFTAHVGAGYYMKDDLSINIELLAGEININEGTEGVASVVGVDLLLRYHFRKEGPWTFYLEGGAGLQQSSDPFPTVGTHFNFRPQAGIGFTVELLDRARLMSGVRWLHISNANKDGPLKNPGYDGVMIYSGLMIPF